jgi:putative addiction module CopG family antidote
MNITLKPELEQYVADQVKAGHYGSVEDVVAAAVTSFMQDQQRAEFAPGELDQLLAEAEAEFARGEGIDADEVFAEIRQMSAEFRQRSAKAGK